MERRIDFIRLDSPIGPLLLADAGHGLCAVHFPAADGAPDLDGLRARLRPRYGSFCLVENAERLSRAAACLEDYFAAPAAVAAYPGPLDPGGTRFQQQVWDRLIRIPPGQTATYGGIARRLGSPLAARAVGAACGANPLGIVIPCHRVVGKSGKLTGFGGGLQLKARLLEMEGWTVPV
ncbi:MAG: methylated-DNA--[protein]-cysteine S-methyltransferase [Candidatus Glassbacteria bacterium]|nr:methylated-DNA--[protein]-cysteine S-methyltransferase [Candidatus Glassbacteria bacterium]